MYFTHPSPLSSEPPCPGCGISLSTVIKTGRVGCAECYKHFERALAPYIRRVHGTASHTGSVPQSAGPELLLKRRAEELRAELARAVEAQEFERCAKLRDEIIALEAQT